ncbi:hypothetical protein PsorP6_008399 [Peronosclerospora sorghi]|uniref:Uncharacterized protein n=1 Tax=Peronosclerospora sorghi TaxID=230839 RepID=A0ACC0W733_9STRA|nr:hypothetical protein PsorP6_008399 [Peronosclerospora sorghi]
MTRSHDEAMKQLGEKLLQGWTMLDSSCPVNDCYTPLMRDKQGKIFCVRCDQLVVAEADIKNKQSEERLSTVSAVEEKEAQDEKERWRRIDQQFCLEEEARKARNVPEQEQVTPRRPMTANAAAKRKIEHSVEQTSPDGDTDVNTIRRQTLAALYQKMRALIDSLSPNDHNERLIAVTKAVRELAEMAQLLNH